MSDCSACMLCVACARHTTVMFFGFSAPSIETIFHRVDISLMFSLWREVTIKFRLSCGVPCSDIYFSCASTFARLQAKQFSIPSFLTEKIKIKSEYTHGDSWAIEDETIEIYRWWKNKHTENNAKCFPWPRPVSIVAQNVLTIHMKANEVPTYEIIYNLRCDHQRHRMN